jgi:hypothetical protein
MTIKKGQQRNQKQKGNGRETLQTIVTHWILNGVFKINRAGKNLTKKNNRWNGQSPN